MLLHVSLELDFWMAAISCNKLLNVTRGIAIVCACNHQSCSGKCGGHMLFKSFNEHLTALISPPFSERQNAMLRIASAGKVRVLRPRRKNSMCAIVNVFATIFFRQGAPVGGQEHGNGV